ncbi:MAG: MoxR family ATPase, partial [Desulfobacteraceae bacterium]|jgi:hypothetical protein
MKPSKIKETLEHLLTINQPVFIWGAPGVGKSQVVAQVAETLGYELQDIRAVLLDPVDLRGLPHIDDKGRAAWCPPDFLPVEGKGILFLDELNAAPPLVQAACYQLVLDRRLGNYHLPDDWRIVAAGNRETDRAVTHRMPSALANRFVHLDFDVDLDDWCTWAIENRLVRELIAFLRFRPNLLHTFDPLKDEKAFPTPRSWEFVSSILSSGNGVSRDYELLAGTVGEGAAAELSGFLRLYHDLPDPDALLEYPETADIPDDPATLYAVCEAVAGKANTVNMPQVVAYARRLPPEFSVLLVRDAVKTDREVVQTDAFSEWATAYSDVLL